MCSVACLGCLCFPSSVPVLTTSDACLLVLHTSPVLHIRYQEDACTRYCEQFSEMVSIHTETSLAHLVEINGRNAISFRGSLFLERF